MFGFDRHSASEPLCAINLIFYTIDITPARCAMWEKLRVKRLMHELSQPYRKLEISLLGKKKTEALLFCPYRHGSQAIIQRREG